jgi:hypothetical protein
MADEKPKMVKVEALKFHTNAGKAYEIGDTYDIEESAVDNLSHQGMAVRVDRVAVAKQAAKDAEKAAKVTPEPKRVVTAKAKKGRRK